MLERQNKAEERRKYLMEERRLDREFVNIFFLIFTFLIIIIIIYIFRRISAILESMLLKKKENALNNRIEFRKRLIEFILFNLL
jgi:predicted nucleic acid-binding Zn ribbon protein